MFLIIVYAYFNSANPERYVVMKSPANFLLLGVLPPTLFAFCSYQIFPHRLDDVDLKEFLLKNRWKIFLPGLLYGIYFTAYKALQTFDKMILIASGVIVLAIIAVASRKYWVLEAFSILVALFAIYIYL
ncbi:MAG: hypothetical protein JXQ90_19180 [Cyclobacteriaceae bacterium]